MLCIGTHKLLNSSYFDSVILRQMGILISFLLKWLLPTQTTVVDRKLQASNTILQNLCLTNMPEMVTSGWKLQYKPKVTW